ncbi:hypothetical protein CR66_02545 [Campylobacter mucosalis]|uniref:hypothetical protein n=1 Tax=Campylobacter mucosalis TaxID=202 RepID=UPI0004D9355F|nr:hypothetical protein [Campylobacter mucosalis]KEA46110.1 hypothetical protein CR66_02545 [Campylobacter mucosalis]QKF62559.1 hypothetical protein CMCT_0392 [Campylobacter mucosalis]
MKFGHLLDIGETTPSIFLKLSKRARLYNFLVLYNACVDKNFQIPIKYALSNSIKEAFSAYIDDLLSNTTLKKNTLKEFCITSNKLIISYKNQNFSNIKKIAKEPKYKVAKLIKMLYTNGEFELIFDANFMFSQFVYDKISKKHFDKNVYFQDSAIIIESGNMKQKLCIIPSFKEFNIENSNQLAREIEYATQFLQNEKCESVYVVTPRHSNFKRHIEVRHCNFADKCIKIVPYTISNKIF